MTENRTSPLESLIGATVLINPQALLNRGKLYTTQHWVDVTKLASALRGLPDLLVEPPKGWISAEKHGLVYIVGDGNHRIGLACIERGQIPFVVVDIWDVRNKHKNKPRYGFNIIVNKIRNELAGSCY
jgi:hypothetical protein